MPFLVSSYHHRFWYLQIKFNVQSQSGLALVKPQNGNLAFKLYEFEDNGFFGHIQGQNYFSLIKLEKVMEN